MSEHPLHDLHVGAGAHGERGSSVPELVRGQYGLADRSGRPVEPGPTSSAVAQNAAPDAGEGEIVAVLAGQGQGEVVDQEPGQRHRPALVGLRRAPDELAAVDPGHRLADVEATPQHIDVTHAQRGELRRAQAAVGPHENREPPVPGLVGQLVDLARGQVATPALAERRQVGTQRRICGQATIADRQAQNARQHAVSLAHRGARLPALGQPGQPRLDLAVLDPDQWHVAPSGQHVQGEDALVPGARGRLQIDLAGQPGRRDLAADLAAVLAAYDRHPKTRTRRR